VSTGQLADLAARVARLEAREEQRDIVARIFCGDTDPSESAAAPDLVRAVCDLMLPGRDRHLRSVP
jgi:hypothetical protein